MDFSNKNILITGGSRGIGAAIYDTFKNLGGNVLALSSYDCDFLNDNIEKFCKTNNAKGTTIKPEKDTERVIAFNSVKIKLLLPNPAWNSRRKNNENDITTMTFAIRSLNDEFDN